jgi:hypothetical protein
MDAPVRSLGRLLGGSKELSMFEAMAVRSDVPLSAEEIRRYSGVSWATTHRRLHDWLALGVVKTAGREGKADKFVLNLNSPAIRALTHAVNATIIELLDSDLAREGVQESDLGTTLPLVELTDLSLDAMAWENESTSTVSCSGVLLAAKTA